MGLGRGVIYSIDNDNVKINKVVFFLFNKGEVVVLYFFFY